MESQPFALRYALVPSCARWHCWLLEPQFVQQLLELLAILGRFDRIDAGTDDRHSRRAQRSRKVQRRLAAELHDDTIGLNAIADVQHIFGRERFEEQQIARVVIRTNGLWLLLTITDSIPSSRRAKLAWQQQ